MSNPSLVYPAKFQTVYADLPADEKQLSFSLKYSWYGKLDGLDKSTQIVPVVMVALGVILMIGSAFAILAAHQILPGGLNSISQLGTTGYGIAYGSIALGVLPLLVGAGVAYRKQKRNALIEQAYQEIHESEKRDLITFLNLKCPKNEKKEFFTVFDDVDNCIFIWRSWKTKEGPEILSREEFGASKQMKGTPLEWKTVKNR